MNSALSVNWGLIYWLIITKHGVRIRHQASGLVTLRNVIIKQNSELFQLQLKHMVNRWSSLFSVFLTQNLFMWVESKSWQLKRTMIELIFCCVCDAQAGSQPFWESQYLITGSLRPPDPPCQHPIRERTSDDIQSLEPGLRWWIIHNFLISGSFAVDRESHEMLAFSYLVTLFSPECPESVQRQ